MIRGSDVTIVIPTISGREHLLERAVNSVNAQLTPVADIVVQHDFDRIGAAATRNDALKRVTTDWVCWLDDDDELLPNHVKVLVRAANRHHSDLFFTYAEFVGGDDPLACIDDNDQWMKSPIHIPFGPKQRIALRNRGNFIPVTYMVRTQLVRDVGGFPEAWTFDAKVSRDCEDYGLLLKLLDAGAEFHHVCGVRTWRYNFHDANLGGRSITRMIELTK